MVKISPYTEYIIDLLSPFGNITAKFMFGGYGVYQNSVMIGLIADDELYFKVDKTNQLQYEELNSEPFTYKAKQKQVKMSYWKVPLEILEDEDRLKLWLEQSYLIALKAKLNDKI